MRLVVVTLAVLFVLGCGDAPSKPVEAPLDPEVAALVENLVNGTGELSQRDAHEALIRHGAVAVRALAKHLDRDDVDDGAGAWIAEVLGGIGEDAAPAAAALGRRLMRGGECSATTSWALGQIGAAGVPPLAAALKCDQPKARIWASHALRVLDEPPPAALDALLPALRDSEWEVRFNAAHAMSDYPALADRWASALLPLTRDPREDVRDGAAASLGEVAAGRAHVQARLREMVLDGQEEPSLRERILEALGEHLGKGESELAFLRAVAEVADPDSELADIARELLASRSAK